jgi:hypothetical protein
MPKFTAKQFVDKVEWEGGLMMATQEYGLSADSLDPESDAELYDAVVAYDAWLKAGEALIARVEKSLDRIDELDDEDDEDDEDGNDES